MEGRDDDRVELRAGIVPQLGKSDLRTAGGAVRPIGRDRLEGVRDEDDAGSERNLLAGEPVRVAGPVPVLVVVQDQSSTGSIPSPSRSEWPNSGCRRTISNSSGVSERGACRIASGRPILPRSWRRPPRRSRSTVSGGEAELDADRLGEHRDDLGVAGGRGVARIDEAHEILRRAQPSVALGLLLELARRVDPNGRRAVEAEPVLSVLLGPVQCAVRGALQLFGRGGVRRIRGDADADRDRPAGRDSSASSRCLTAPSAGSCPSRRARTGRQTRRRRSGTPRRRRPRRASR